MRREYVDTPEGQIHYVTEGSGTPLLLLHQSPLSWTMYRRMVPLLSGAHRVLVMDTLGFGSSDPAPSSCRQIGDYAQNIVHFLDALGIDKCDIWGTFTGSHIAAEVAAAWPQRVRRLILLGFPIFLTAVEQRDHIEAAKKEMPRFAPDTEGRFVMKILELGLGKLAPGDKIDRSIPVDLQYLTDWVAEAVKAGPAFDEMAMRVYSYDGRSRLPLIQADTLVIGLDWGKVVWFIRGQRARAVQSLIPHSELAMLTGPGTDMQVTYVRAGELAGIVLPFLEARTS